MNGELFLQALKIHKSGKILEAQEKYKEILKYFPGHAPTLHYYGLSFYQFAEYKKAIHYFNKSISIDTNQPKVFSNRGNANVFLKKYDEAMLDYKKAIKLDPNFSLVYFNQGRLFLDLKNYKKAKKSLEKFLILDPNNSAGFVNLGIVLNRLDENVNSKKKFDHAISLQPEFAEAYSSRAMLFAKTGKFDAALNDFKRSLDLKNNNISSFNNLLFFLIQIEDIKFLKNIKNAKTICKTNLLSSTYMLIYSLIIGKFEDLKYFLKITNDHLSNNNFYSINDENRKFILGYLKLISSLIKEKEFVTYPKYLPKIYHIGESHCLSFAHRILKFKKDNYIVIPKLCFGVKAYHLAQNNKNTYKSIIRKYIEEIPKKSIIFFSIGEIDCRLDEGFIKAIKKNKIDTEILVKETVSKFLKFLNIYLKRKNHIVYFLNVPAPIFKKKVETKDAETLLKVINLFNNFLNYYATSLNYKVVNVNRITSNHFGRSNKLFHCDDKHLGPRVIDEIEKLL